MNKKALGVFLLVFVLVFLDQWIKIYIKLNYPLGEVTRFADWFIIHFTENPGMAFGMEWGGKSGKLALSIFRILASLVGIYYLYYILKKKYHFLYVTSISLILAGTIGNIIDSIFYGVLFTESTEWTVSRWAGSQGGYAGWLEGHVVDMFYFPIISGYYPSWVPFVGGQEFLFFRFIFNLADACISIGVFILFIFQKKWQNKSSEIQPNNSTNVNINNTPPPA